MRINNNVYASNTQRQLYETGERLGKSLERLSSGMRINKAADDAAGLGVSEKLRSQVSGLQVASDNCQDGIAVIQTAEGALDRTHVILRRIRDLTEMSANGDKTDDDRQKYQAEIDQLISEVDRISTTTEYNTKKLLNGALGITVTEDQSLLSTASNPAAIIEKDFVSSVSIVGDVSQKGVYTIEMVGLLDNTIDKVANTQYAAANATAVSALGATTSGTDTLQAAYGMVTAGETETITFTQPNLDHDVSVTLGQGDTINEAITKMQDKLDQGGFEVDVTWDLTNNTFLFAAQNRGSAYDFSATAVNSAGAARVVTGTMTAATTPGSDMQVTVYAPNGTTTTITSTSSTFKADLDTYDKDKAVDDAGINQGIVGLEFKLNVDDVTDGNTLMKVGLDVSGVLTIQAGPNKGNDHRISMSIPDMGASALGIEGLDVTTQEAAQNLIDSETLDKAISVVSTARGNLGALQNRLEHTIKNLATTKENLASSESRIRDTDMASEMSEFTRNQIMQQAGTAMLAQANQIPQTVLQLLG